jgi:hypothetical protein
VRDYVAPHLVGHHTVVPQELVHPPLVLIVI